MQRLRNGAHLFSIDSYGHSTGAEQPNVRAPNMPGRQRGAGSPARAATARAMRIGPSAGPVCRARRPDIWRMSPVKGPRSRDVAQGPVPRRIRRFCGSGNLGPARTPRGLRLGQRGAFRSDRWIAAGRLPPLMPLGME